MDSRIEYLNTDLDLTSPAPLSELAAALDAGGVRSLYAPHADNGAWYAVFETSEQFTEPEPNIAAMLDVIESISAPLRSVWDGCVKREFNIGYDCGNEPWSFTKDFPMS